MFLFTTFLCADSVLAADDNCFTFNGISFIKPLDYGTFLMYIMNLVLFVIPYNLNINLQDWCLAAGGLIKAFVISGIFIYIYKFLRQNDNSLNTSLFASAILYALFFVLHSRLNFIDFIINEGFFRFIIPAFLMEVFFYYFYKLWKGEKVNLYLLGIIAFFTALSSEVTGEILISGTIFSILYKLLRNKEEKFFIKSSACILFLLVIGFTLLLQTKGFQNHINTKLSENGFNFINFSEFLIIYAKSVIWNNIVLYIVLAILWIKNKENAIYSFIVLLSTFSFFLSLFFMGKTHYSKEYWLYHADLYTFLIMGILISTAAALKKINFKICIIAFVILLFPFIISASHLKTALINVKNMYYLRDKITAFYTYKGEVPIIPEVNQFLAIYMFLRRDTELSLNKKINFKEKIHVPNVYNSFFDGGVLEYYYPIIYKIKPISNEFIVNDNAIYIFKENGGSLDEIETNKYKFSYLTDKEFVLGNISKVKK